MSVAQWILLGCAASYCTFAAVQLIRLFKRMGLSDPSEKKGPLLPGFIYSLSGGMSPAKKETAFLHLPTYAAGIIYHLASFLALAWIILHLIGLELPFIARMGSALLIGVGAVNGLLILIKRIALPKMRAISAPDDYASNLIVTVFQALSALTLIWPVLLEALYIVTGLLFVYMQIGKLRHALFFVLVRMYLGFFYGRRGVWPPKRRHEWQKRTL